MTRRILIVDDEPDFTDALKTGLQRRGFRATTFNDPKEALADYGPGAYDLSILDIRMPGMNGFELYREMKKIDREANVCFLTAFEVHRDEFGKMFPDMEVKAFLRKPITIDRLVTSLNGLLP